MSSSNSDTLLDPWSHALAHWITGLEDDGDQADVRPGVCGSSLALIRRSREPLTFQHLAARIPRRVLSQASLVCMVCLVWSSPMRQ